MGIIFALHMHVLTISVKPDQGQKVRTAIEYILFNGSHGLFIECHVIPFIECPLLAANFGFYNEKHKQIQVTSVFSLSSVCCLIKSESSAPKQLRSSLSIMKRFLFSLVRCDGPSFHVQSSLVLL